MTNNDFDPRRLPFFHGTGAAAAANILANGGCNALDQMGWGNLASGIWSALREFGTEQKLSRQYNKYDDLLKGPGLRPLRSAFERQEGHHYVYGPFFATLDIADAYRYTVRNRLRSEFLLAISHGLTFLEKLGGASQARELERRYPTILNSINNPSSAVVLELLGIDESRLATENGNRPALAQIERYLRETSSGQVSRAGSFRIDDLRQVMSLQFTT